MNNLPNFNFEDVDYYVELGGLKFVLEVPDDPFITTIGRVPTIQEEVELGRLRDINFGWRSVQGLCRK